MDKYDEMAETVVGADYDRRGLDTSWNQKLVDDVANAIRQAVEAETERCVAEIKAGCPVITGLCHSVCEECGAVIAAIRSKADDR